MSAPESIVLPRSGVRASVIPTHYDGAWDIRLPHDNLLLAYSRDRQAAIEDADRYALSLLAALLAGTEERIARWIVERDANRYGRSWEDTPDCQRDDARSAATDLLSALTGGTDG